jgi:small subunit ribosomal protein S2
MADACIEGRQRYQEKQQAEADKAVDEKKEEVPSSADLKPGERKVISDGSDGPVVEIIRRSEADAPEEQAPAAAEEAAAPAEDTQAPDTETTGE